MHPIGSASLNAFKVMGIVSELHQRRHFFGSSKLGVIGLVAMHALGRRRLRRSQQEVGVTTPAAIEERRLEDDVGTTAHRFDRVDMALR